MEKTSPYLMVAFANLRKQKKFKTVKVGATNHIVFDTLDIWDEICKTHKKVSLYIHRGEE